MRLRKLTALAIFAGLIFPYLTLAQGVVLERTSPDREVRPGELATHVFSLVNQGDAPLSVELSLDYPEGWGLLTPMGELQLAPEAEELVFVTLAVPRTARAGNYRIRLQAAWPGGSASESGTIRVLEVYQVEVVAPGDGNALPGSSVTYRFSVVNRGNTVGRFGVSAESSHDWPVEVRPRELSLSPGERAPVEVVVSVPLGTEVDRDLLSLSVTSLDEAGVQATANLFTQVLPPTPELVTGSPYAELNARIEGALWGHPLLPSFAAEVLLLQIHDADLTAEITAGLEEGNVPEALTSVLADHGLALPPGAMVEELGEDRWRLDSRYTVVLEEGALAIYGPKSRGTLLDLVADGELLGGSFSLSLQVADAWDTRSYSLSGLSFLYLRDQVRIEAGEVSLSLTPLLSVSGQGLEVELAPEGWSLSFLSGWRGEEARTGGRVLARQGEWEWGLAYREARGEEQAAAADAWTRVPISDGLGALFEIGLGYTAPFTDRAVLVRLAADAWPPLRLRLDGFSVGPYFPGRRRDQEGIALSGSLAAEPAALRFTMEHRWDNVWRVPGVPSVVRSSLNLAFQWAPEKWPLGFSSGVAVDRVREETPNPGTDYRTRRLEAGLAGGESPLSFSLTCRWRENMDFLTGLKRHSLEYQERFYLTMEQATAILNLEQDAAYDGDWALVDSDWSASFSLRTRGSPHFFSFSWTQASDGGEAEFGVEYRVTPDFMLTGGGHSRWDSDGKPTSLRLQGGFAYEFTWKPPFLPAKGWVEGRVFLDSDLDGTFDPGEAGIAAAVLAIEGVRVSTDAQGRFRFPPLAPGEYQVTLERLPSGARPLTPGPFTVEVEAAGHTTLTIPCELLASIRGVVYDDGDQDGQRAPSEPGVPGVLVLLLTAAGEELARVTTGPGGEFSFPKLSSGDYLIRLATGSLPGRYEPTTPAEVRLSLSPGEEAQLEFGIWQRPRPVVVTYQPPFADFVWEPEQPVAGQPVRFDGSTSADFDGEITDYSWDFDGDGAPDASGPVVEWTFPAPGVYQVSLTVTDDDGNQDTFTQEVEVSPAG